MPRRKSNLSELSARAKRARLRRAREEEAEVEIQERSLSRAQVSSISEIADHSENDLSLSRRRIWNRIRMAERRAVESQEERERRRESNRIRMTERRAVEAREEQESRRESNRFRMAEQRAVEAEEEQESRRESNRIRMAERRAVEAQEEQENRRESNRIRMAERRAVEAEEEQERRRESNRIRMAERRNRQRVTRGGREREEEIAEETRDQQRPWLNKEESGYTYNIGINYSQSAEIGTMSEVCTHCHALKWKKEAKGMCCSGGKVRLDAIEEPPEPLRSLLLNEHPQSEQFLKNIRAYNSAFQMTSFGANQISEGNFMPTFRVQGQVYHLIGSLLPVENEAKFLQLYFIADHEAQVSARGQIIPDLDQELLSSLQRMLHEVNRYIVSFKSALDSVSDSDLDSVKFIISADRRPASEHRGRYNAPTCDEVAVVMVDTECDRRDIVLRSKEGQLQRISETHRSYDALQYPLMFCRGEDGYHFTIFNIHPETGEANQAKKTSAQQYYGYMLQIRSDYNNHIHRFRDLFSQFLVDMYAKIETERLIYIRNNQKKLRVENYIDLKDAVGQDGDVENVGRLVILPSSFVGGPRYMHERTQDAFCYVRKYGRPDLFITFTTNPKWEEIRRELFPGQRAQHRHDIVARVFHLKLKILIDLLTKEKIFGTSLGFMYSVEWQKRGLPHAHILLWLEAKIRPNQMDHVISAEIPDPEVDPALHSIVKSHMIHGPCGHMNLNSPCMQGKKCTKKFPKAFTEVTVTGEDGYPHYRRRSPEQGGFTATVSRNGQDLELDNRWIVPYSPVLSRTFQAHINVESCSSVNSIKYICKYINKGSDQATFALQNDKDEVTKYQSGRYISTSEAVWRILSFPIHERFPPVMHLDVHLENGQRVYFNAENVRERIENPRRTTLMAFFELCRVDEFARTLKYDEIPAFYTFDRQRGVFNRRKRGTPVEGFPGVFRDHVLGRVYTVHIRNMECYHLRLLLQTVRGPTDFKSLRTYDDTEYPTYQAACKARGLLEDDKNWDDTLAEGSLCESPSRLRHLFAIMLVHCDLSNQLHLWEKYYPQLSEDFLRAARGLNENIDAKDEEIVNRCLLALQEVVIEVGGTDLLSYGLPAPRDLAGIIGNENAAESNYDREELIRIIATNVPNLTEEQKLIYEEVLRSVENNEGKIFFIDAPGGTGKTFLTTTILATVREQGKIALAVASSGIAATLLPGGKTAHSLFRIPLLLDDKETPMCSISRNSSRAELLRSSSLIVWDECSMAHKKAVEAVDRIMQDIRRSESIMGGLTVVFCGDFRQILPVINRGTRADEVRASLKKSYLWRSISRKSLTVNMRARIGNGTLINDFSRDLLKVGEGKIQEENGKIELPPTICKSVESMEELIQRVYGEVKDLKNKTNTWLCERAILCPKNEQVRRINGIILDQLEGQITTYTSINKVMQQEEATNYPVEFLNSLNVSGLPEHNLKLKVGVPIMLLRNLRPPQLCNGTRLKITSLQKNIIHAEILTGCAAGDMVMIPRIPLIPSNFPFQFKRLQFPVSVCYAMTINKSQGQTLRTAGIDLSTDCFTHGQLYVACSRVSRPEELFVFAPDKKTTNVVYKEVLEEN